MSAPSTELLPARPYPLPPPKTSFSRRGNGCSRYTWVRGAYAVWWKMRGHTVTWFGVGRMTPRGWKLLAQWRGPLPFEEAFAGRAWGENDIRLVLQPRGAGQRRRAALQTTRPTDEPQNSRPRAP